MKANLRKPKPALFRWYHRLLGIEPKERDKSKVRIDPWDAWNVDYTLSRIALSLLKHYREVGAKKAFPVGIEEEDIPEDIDRAFEDDDEKKHAAWKAIVDKMIRAHEIVVNEELIDAFVASRMKEDYLDSMKYNEISQEEKEGLRLFAKYYRHLWW